jgi:hypothetical protein
VAVDEADEVTLEVRDEVTDDDNVVDADVDTVDEADEVALEVTVLVPVLVALVDTDDVPELE